MIQDGALFCHLTCKEKSWRELALPTNEKQFFQPVCTECWPSRPQCLLNATLAKRKGNIITFNGIEQSCPITGQYHRSIDHAVEGRAISRLKLGVLKQDYMYEHVGAEMGPTP